MNDFDRIAEEIDRGLVMLAASVYPETGKGETAAVCDAAAFSRAIGKIARASEWAKGHAQSRRDLGAALAQPEAKEKGRG